MSQKTAYSKWCWITVRWTSLVKLDYVNETQLNRAPTVSNCRSIAWNNKLKAGLHPTTKQSVVFHISDMISVAQYNTWADLPDATSRAEARSYSY